jgi:hypothetical protein
LPAVFRIGPGEALETFRIRSVSHRPVGAADAACLQAQVQLPAGGNRTSLAIRSHRTEDAFYLAPSHSLKRLPAEPVGVKQRQQILLAPLLCEISTAAQADFKRAFQYCGLNNTGADRSPQTKGILMNKSDLSVECRVRTVMGGQSTPWYKGLAHIVRAKYDEQFTACYGSVSIACTPKQLSHLQEAGEVVLHLADNHLLAVNLMGSRKATSTCGENRNVEYFVAACGLDEKYSAADTPTSGCERH